MTEPVFVQVSLEHITELSDRTGILRRNKVCWLPSRFGHIGKLVRLQEDNRDWTVTDIHGRATAKDLERRARAHKNQRKASDI